MTDAARSVRIAQWEEGKEVCSKASLCAPHTQEHGAGAVAVAVAVGVAVGVAVPVGVGVGVPSHTMWQ